MGPVRVLVLSAALSACATTAQTISAPLAPPANAAEPDPFIGCWRPQSPNGPLRDAHSVCFERDRYWILMASDWDAARVTFVPVSRTEWRLERDSSLEISIAFVDGGLAFTVGTAREMLVRASAESERAAYGRIAKLPTIETLCDRAQRCIEAAGARLPDEEDDTDRVLASTCIHDVEDTVKLLRQRDRDVPRECGP